MRCIIIAASIFTSVCATNPGEQLSLLQVRAGVYDEQDDISSDHAGLGDQAFDNDSTTTTTVVSLEGLDDEEREDEIVDEQIRQYECKRWCYKKPKAWTGDRGKCN